MPEENQSPPPSISPSLGKHSINWKKILLILFIAGISVSLISGGVWFLLSEPTLTTLDKTTTSSAQKQTTNKKGVLYLKNSGQSSTLPAARLLGNLWIYDLASKKETQITKDGRVANYSIKLSPNGKNIAYRKNIGDMESLWIYDFQTKNEKKLAEFTTIVSDSEYARIENIVWREDSEAIAVLVVNRKVVGDPRDHTETKVIVKELADKAPTENNFIGLDLEYSWVSLLAFNKNELFLLEGNELGPFKIKTLNVVNEKLSEKNQFLKEVKVLPEILGGPDSQKIAVSGNTTRVFDIRSGEQIFIIESSIIGWTNNGDGIIYKSAEDGKTKLTIHNIKNNKFESALFPAVLLKESYNVLGFSDLSSIVISSYDSDTNNYKYYVLELGEAIAVDLPFTTQSRVTTIPIENF